MTDTKNKRDLVGLFKEAASAVAESGDFGALQKLRELHTETTLALRAQREAAEMEIRFLRADREEEIATAKAEAAAEAAERARQEKLARAAERRPPIPANPLHEQSDETLFAAAQRRK